jgi:hypothetical protein
LSRTAREDLAEQALPCDDRRVRKLLDWVRKHFSVTTVAGLLVVCYVWYVAAEFEWARLISASVLLFTLLLLPVSIALLREEHRPLLEPISKWATIVAFGATALYFLFRLAAGQFSNDMVVSVSTDRVSTAKGDVVAIVATLKHERERSVRLLDAVAYIRRTGRAPIERRLTQNYYRRQLDDSDRLIDKSDKAIGRSPTPVINPGDQLQLASYVEVGRNDVLVIDVVVGIPPIGLVPGQWISSTVSLPLKIEPKPAPSISTTTPAA